MMLDRPTDGSAYSRSVRKNTMLGLGVSQA
jgi:hypothetical protein